MSAAQKVDVVVVRDVPQGCGFIVNVRDVQKAIDDLVKTMEQIDRLSREADRSTIDVASMLGDIARAALARLEVSRG